ncbi:hypothetical protein MPER_03712 [Moniliophthora perniciosa FA553]|nr:hypothetical protein MPER_03712 [Moniliophthora perniciosa FA553]
MQRLYLELLAGLDWVEVYKPRIEGAVANVEQFPSASYPQVDDVVGAFVLNPETAQHLQLAAIPVWVLRPTEHNIGVRVLDHVRPKQPADLLQISDLHPPHESIWTGFYTNLFSNPHPAEAKIVAMEKYASSIVSWFSPVPRIDSEPVVERPSKRPKPPPPSKKHKGQYDSRGAHFGNIPFGFIIYQCY